MLTVLLWTLVGSHVTQLLVSVVSGQYLLLVGDSISPTRREAWNSVVHASQTSRLSGMLSLEVLSASLRSSMSSGVMGILPGVGSLRLLCPSMILLVKLQCLSFISSPISLCKHRMFDIYWSIVLLCLFSSISHPMKWWTSGSDQGKGISMPMSFEHCAINERTERRCFQVLRDLEPFAFWAKLAACLGSIPMAISDSSVNGPSVLYFPVGKALIVGAVTDSPRLRRSVEDLPLKAGQVPGLFLLGSG